MAEQAKKASLKVTKFQRVVGGKTLLFSVEPYNGRIYAGARYMYQDSVSGELVPGKNGISIGLGKPEDVVPDDAIEVVQHLLGAIAEAFGMEYNAVLELL